MDTLNDFPEECSRAKTSALRLLKIRPRSEHELRDRLKRKKFSPEVIEETIRYLKSYRFIDDAAFAKAWIKYRLTKPLGMNRIIQELKIKGIADDIIQDQRESAQEDLDEPSAVESLVKKKLKLYQNIEPLKRKKRIFDFLARRGFSLSLIQQAIRKL